MDGKRTVLSGLLLTGLALVVLIGGALAPQSALAATLYISEFASPVTQVGSVQSDVYPAPAVTDQTVAITGASVQSAAFNARTHAIMIECDADCSVLIGANPTTTTTNFLMGDGIPYFFGVTPGQKIAVISNSSGGSGSDVNLVAVGGAAIALGQTTMAASLPVAIASNQSAVPTSNSTQLPAALGQATMAASLPVTLASNQSTITTQMAGWSFQNITTSTTTTVKSGAGVLHIVNVNTLGTVASTVTVYDNTAGSGTKIATINSLTLSGPFQYDIAFSTGLTLVTTGTAAPDITVSYR